MLVGAFPAPPMGPGPGKLALVPLQGGTPYTINFGKAGAPSGNSFYVAKYENKIFVPSVAGTTEVLSIRTGKLLRRFNSIPGGRVAVAWPGHGLVFILSGKALAAYSTSSDAMRFQVPFGGNAMIFNSDGSRLYVGGNMDSTIAEIDPSTGRILRQIPIGHSGDLAWAHGLLFSADIKSGVMTAFNPVTSHTYHLATPEIDPNFTYKKIPAAAAGFMQLAVSHSQQYVYAAGFSGHILRFSAKSPAYLGQVTVSVGKPGPNKLSGLAVLPNGQQAIATIENRHESVIVDLNSGKIIKQLPGIASNRWILVDPTTAHGLIKLRSARTFADTMRRLEAAIRQRHLQITAVVNHSAAAHKAGLSLRPTELVIFGNPTLGSKLMQINQETGLDLPLKVLVWKDSKNRVWLGYNDPKAFADRYSINPLSMPIVAMTKALYAITKQAAGS